MDSGEGLERRSRDRRGGQPDGRLSRTEAGPTADPGMLMFVHVYGLPSYFEADSVQVQEAFSRDNHTSGSGSQMEVRYARAADGVLWSKDPGLSTGRFMWRQEG